MAMTMHDKAAEKKNTSQWPADIAAEFARRSEKPQPLRRLDFVVGE